MQLDIDESLLSYPTLEYLKKVSDKMTVLHPPLTLDIYKNILEEEFSIFKRVLDYIPGIYDEYTTEEIVSTANRIYRMKGLTDSLEEFGIFYKLKFTFQMTEEGILVTEVQMLTPVNEVSLLMNAIEELVLDLLLCKATSLAVSDVEIEYNHHYIQVLPISWDRLSSFKGRFYLVNKVETPVITQSTLRGSSALFSWDDNEDWEGMQVDCNSKVSGYTFPIYIPRRKSLSVQLPTATGRVYYFRAYNKNHIFSEKGVIRS